MNENDEISEVGFVPCAKDVLLRRARLGELNSEEAELEAKRLGLGPLASLPPSDAFDPKEKPLWSLPMVLAWIVWRDFREVRHWDNDYRKNCYRWQVVHMQSPNIDGSFGDLMRGFSVEPWELASAKSFLCFGYRRSDNSSMIDISVLDKGRAELWGALLRDKLIGMGIPAGGGPRISVPACEWSDLEPASRDREDGDFFRFRHDRRGLAYTDILWRGDQVLSVWPENEAIYSRPVEAITTVHRAPQPKDVTDLRKWIEESLAAGERPRTRKEVETWAKNRGLGVIWARDQHSRLPSEKKLPRGTSKPNWKANRQ